MMHSAEEDGGGEGWECLRCREGVKWVERSVVDGGGSEVSGSEYEFSSDMDLDVTDVSESVGSYSELGLSD
jgi:peroxin-2